MKAFFFISVVFFANIASASCYAPWGARVPEGSSVQAFYDQRPRAGDRCRSEWRTCRNGWLSGSYRYQSCHADNGCDSAEFGYIRHGQSIRAFLNNIETGGHRCQVELRTCAYGRLSGSYRYRSCTEMP